MQEFEIYVDVCLGCECSGRGVFADGYGTVRLEDDQVDQVIALIRENGGETDIEKLGLEEKYPEIYEALNDAYTEAARDATYSHWLIEGFEWGYYDEPEDLMQTLEEEGLFQYVSDPDDIEGLDEEELEEAKEEAFSDWLIDYFHSLSKNEKVEFIENYYGDIDYNYDPIMSGYTIEIPRGIVDLV